MRVLQVVNSLTMGGAERLLLETIPLFNSRGVVMDLLVLNGTEHPFLKALKDMHCCNIYSLGAGSLFRPTLAWKMLPYLKQYDIVHVHLFPSLYWTAIAKVFSRSGIKAVYTEHSTSNRRMRKAWLGVMQTVIYKRYDRIVCITEEVFHVLKQHTKMRGETFVVIENGVNLAKIRVAQALPRSDFFADAQARILIQVASFQEPKDQLTVIRALARLPEQVKVMFVGEGPLKAGAQALVDELGLADRVCFLGLRMDVPQLLKTADVVILSSKFEGLSLSSIEGMASGRPFVASEAPGLTEMVSGAGVLFPSQDDEALAAVIGRLLSDGAYYEQVVGSCLARANAFDIETMVGKHVVLYEGLV